MPQYDAYHETVKRALVKDGWTITHDPFIIQYDDLRLFADLGAERIFAAERGEREIVVEIKVFGRPSFINDFHKATGQYSNYRSLLRHINPHRKIYLAVAQGEYKTYFERLSIQAIITDQQINLLIFDLQTEEVVQWID